MLNGTLIKNDKDTDLSVNVENVMSLGYVYMDLPNIFAGAWNNSLP